MLVSHAERTLKGKNLESFRNTLRVLRELPGIRPSEDTDQFLTELAAAKALFDCGTAHSAMPPLPETIGKALAMLEKPPWMSEFRYYLNVDGLPDLLKIVVVAETVGYLLANPDIDAWFKDKAKNNIYPLLMNSPTVYGRSLAERLLRLVRR